MEFTVGIILALLLCGAASWLRMDRDRVFYPAMLIVVASYYVLFAVVGGGGGDSVRAEVAIALLFTGLAVAGFKRNLWLVVAALAGHGLMDFVHHGLVQNPGVPPGWPGFCAAFDLTAAVCAAGVLALREHAGVARHRPDGR